MVEVEEEEEEEGSVCLRSMMTAIVIDSMVLQNLHKELYEGMVELSYAVVSYNKSLR